MASLLKNAETSWLILKIRDKDPIPTVDGLDIKIVEKAVA
jgi:hypothetical protein